MQIYDFIKFVSLVRTSKATLSYVLHEVDQVEEAVVAT